MRNHRSTGAGRRRVLASLFASVLAVGGTMLPALPAGAVTCVVNGISNADEGDIQDLLDVGGPSTVTFAGDCAGHFDIERNVTVLGASGATVDGEGNASVFYVGSGATVVFRNLTITGGSEYVGGGIQAENGIVTIDRVTFVENEGEFGGAVYVGPESLVTITSSTFRGNYAEEGGGAIGALGGEFSVTGSRFEGNIGEIGGAILAVAAEDFDDSCSGSPQAIVSRSTFTANLALIGGAISLFSTGLTVSGSTFTRHEGVQYGGAIFAIDPCEVDPVVSVNTSTFTSNLGMPGAGEVPMGGAVFVAAIGELSVASSKFTGNRSFVGGAVFAGTGNEYFEGTTFDEDNTEVTITGSTFTGNRAEYDGGAVAIDSNLDFPVEPMSVSASTFTSNTALSNGGALFFLDAPVDVIGSTFTRNRAEGLGFDAPTMGGGAIGFFSEYTGDLSVMDVGPAEPDLDIQRSRFISNSSGAGGGAIGGQAGYGRIEVSGSTFTGNQATESGGGMFLQNAFTRVRGSTFSSNEAVGDGGGVAMDSFDYSYAGSIATDRATRFVNNRAGDEGGAISTYDADVLFSGVATGNSAGHGGGAIAFDTGEGADVNLEISAATIERNTAVDEGGGVWVDAEYGSDVYIYDGRMAGPFEVIGTLSVGPVSISFNRVTSNAYGTGGGIHVWAVDEFFIATVNDRPGTVTIQRNSAPNDGGGIYVDGANVMYLDGGVRIAYNTYGGVYACGGPWGATYVGNVGYGIIC